MLLDTHAHIDAEAFDNDREEVIQRAREVGIGKIVNVGFNREMIESTLKLIEKHSTIYGAVGWHPVDAVDMTAADLKWIESLCSHKKIVAIGETGLDYHWDRSPREIQQKVFREQIALAKKVSLPLIIHNREAHQDVVDILKEEQASQVGGIMHCYSGSWEIAKECLDMNFYISFGGPITFKNAKQPKEVLAKVPLNRLLIETDSPYLAPHPYRGKRNEPSYIQKIAAAAAEIKNISYDELIDITSENAHRCFQFIEQ